MHYTIYQTTNTANGKIYVGKHQTLNPNDGYLGSGKAIVAAIKKHGRNYFSKKVLHLCNTEEEMNRLEAEIITEEFVSRKDTYNIGVGGEGGAHFKGKKHSAESLAKMVANRSPVKHSAETRRKISETQVGRVFSDETRLKLSLAAKARHAKNRDLNNAFIPQLVEVPASYFIMEREYDKTTKK